jgi:hypothetical protein
VFRNIGEAWRTLRFSWLLWAARRAGARRGTKQKKITPTRKAQKTVYFYWFILAPTDVYNTNTRLRIRRTAKKYMYAIL